jgi:hypothetical protein
VTRLVEIRLLARAVPATHCLAAHIALRFRGPYDLEMPAAPWEISSNGKTLHVAIHEDASTLEFEVLLDRILAEVKGGARHIVLVGPGVEKPSHAADAFVRVLLGHRRDLDISVTLPHPRSVDGAG